MANATDIPIDFGAAVRFVRMFVDVEQAKEWLANMDPRNRVVTRGKVRMYASDLMRKGGWLNIAEFITFSPEGKMNGGRHRLEAIVLANTGAWMNVAFNVETDDMIRYGNQGHKATRKGILEAMGIPFAGPVSAIENKLFSFDIKGHKLGLGTNRILNGHAQHTPFEMEEYLTEHLDEINASLPYAKAVKSIISEPAAGFLYVLLARENQQQAHQFFTDLVHTDALHIDDPVRQLTRLLLDNTTHKRYQAGEQVFRACCGWAVRRRGLLGKTSVSNMVFRARRVGKTSIDDVKNLITVA